MSRRLLSTLLSLAELAGDTSSVVCGVDDGTADALAGGGAGGGGDATPPKTEAAPAAAPEAAKATTEAQLALAKELGFTSIDEMKAAVAAAKKKPEATPPAKKPDATAAPAAPAPAKKPEAAQPAAEMTTEQLKAENDKLQRKLADLTRQGKKATAEAEQAKLRLEQVESEHALRDAARKAGILSEKGVKFALFLLQEALAPLTPEDVAKFNEDDFFAGLKEEHAHLFGAVEKPATTTTGGAGGGEGGSSPPKPEDAASRAASGAKFDAMKASPTDLEEYMRKNFPGVRIRN